MTLVLSLNHSVIGIHAMYVRQLGDGFGRVDLLSKQRENLGGILQGFTNRFAATHHWPR